MRRIKCMSGDEMKLVKDESGSVGYKLREEEKSWAKKLKILQDKPYLITLGLAGVFLIGVGIVSAGMIADQAGDGGVEIMEMSEEGEKTQVFVDVGGAVMQPGLYKLGGEARINDALVMAGGLSEKADRDWFSKNINLAQKVSDGSKIYIVFKGEGQAASEGSSGTVAGTAVTGKIDVNTASATELDRLWGVGLVTAEKIIKGRPYSSVEELKTKKVLKSNVYERIKDKLSVY